MTHLIRQSLILQGRIFEETLAPWRFVCFGAYMANVVQDMRIGVVFQIQEKHALFMVGMHYIAHSSPL
jgi:hypothetical protein